MVGDHFQNEAVMASSNFKLPTDISLDGFHDNHTARSARSEFLGGPWGHCAAARLPYNTSVEKLWFERGLGMVFQMSIFKGKSITKTLTMFAFMLPSRACDWDVAYFCRKLWQIVIEADPKPGSQADTSKVSLDAVAFQGPGWADARRRKLEIHLQVGKSTAEPFGYVPTLRRTGLFA